MNLTDDIRRGVGRFGLGPDDAICERRHQCARYRAMDNDRERFPGGYPSHISVATGLCRDGGDWCIPVEVEA